MNRIPCSVVRDLMILYEDDVCSEESRQMIDSHIKECEACRDAYQRSKQPLPEISFKGEGGNSDSENGDEFWEIARRAVRKFERKLTYRHVLIFGTLFLAVIAIVTVWSEWLQFRVNLVPSEDVRISELYELENGDIYCTFTCEDILGTVNISDMKVPEGKGFQDYDQGWYEVSFQYPMFYEKLTDDKIYGNEVSVVFKKQSKYATNWIQDEEGKTIPDEASVSSTHTCASIYYNGKNKEDRLLVWEEGQELDPAPEEIEAKVREDMLSSDFLLDYYWMFTTRIIR